MRALAVMVSAAVLFGQAPPDPNQRLIQARRMLVERHARLPDYVCVQTVDRQYFKHRNTSSSNASCDRIRTLGSEDLVLEATDRLRLDLKLSQGREIGSWSGSRFSSRSVFDLIGGGPYETGMLGTLISDVFLNGGAAYRYCGEQTSGGSRLFQYDYEVPLEASHYQIKSGPGWAPAAFSGAFWLDGDSLELRRLKAQSTDLPPESGACEFATTVDYQMARAGSGAFLLPSKSSMRTVLNDGREVQLNAVYSGCRQYRGEATIRFDEAAGGDEVKPAAKAALPAKGLVISLALAEPIDSDTAAAGDLVKAKVRWAVRDPKRKSVLIPAGATAEIRIVQMWHALGKSPHFAISLVLEQVEIAGAPVPLYAAAERRATLGDSGVLPRTVDVAPFTGSRTALPASKLSLVNKLVFVTRQGHCRIPAGYLTDWITIAPPD